MSEAVEKTRQSFCEKTKKSFPLVELQFAQVDFIASGEFAGFLLPMSVTGCENYICQSSHDSRRKTNSGLLLSLSWNVKFSFCLSANVDSTRQKLQFRLCLMCRSFPASRRKKDDHLTRGLRFTIKCVVFFLRFWKCTVQTQPGNPQWRLCFPAWKRFSKIYLQRRDCFSVSTMLLPLPATFESKLHFWIQNAWLPQNSKRKF